MRTNIADAAVVIGTRAAAEWFRSHPEARADDAAFAECLRANLKIRLPEALRDAKEALDAGMARVAETTFAATIALAGIDAAKESAILA